MARRGWAFLVLLVLGGALVAVGIWRWPLEVASQDAAPPADELALRSQLHVSAKATRATLLAAGAVADSPEIGVRRVIVRVVDEMDVDVRFEASRSLTLPTAPYLCLVGPFWAPDDAGLSDRCWGDPDLRELAADQLQAGDGDPWRLEAGTPVVVSARLRRGDAGCDYPPGLWTLEVAFSPPGTPPGRDRLTLEDVVLEVPFAHAGTLPLLAPGDSRYCGLANIVVRDQGEPEVSIADPVASELNALSGRP